MHIKDAKHIVKKARYWRESSKETSKNIKFVDDKLWRLSSKARRSDTIHVILSVLIKLQT